MESVNEGLGADVQAAFEARMREAAVSDGAREAFHRMYRAYRSHPAAAVRWDEVAPPDPGDLVDLSALEGPECEQRGRVERGRLVWIVLNGGLGTSMKMDRAKSLLPVKGDLTFLDLTARHVLSLRERWGEALPLVFMNSFATRRDTREALGGYPLTVAHPERGPLPVDFLQDRFPRIREVDGLPFGEAAAPEAWAPPGHGNLYPALAGSGLLAELLGRGYRWAFVSNADNLGASPHPGILGFLAREGLAFAMEVTDKTAADVKGGTLIRRAGRLELLEIAQVPADHVADFQDVGRFPVFNTNNLWVDLRTLAERLATGPLDLPLIVNRKRVGRTAVVQLESAMGAAIGAFARSAGIRVGRHRFAPVKTTDDLLVRRSDAYVLGERSPLVPNPARAPALGPPVVRLDPAHYGSVPELDRRIPEPPSLVRAGALRVQGDVRFGAGVVVRGDVELVNPGPDPLWIEPGTVLAGPGAE